MHAFQCPHCSAPLRIREKVVRQKEITCPDCSAPVLLEESHGKVIGVLPNRPSLAPGMPVQSPISFKVLFAILGVLIAVGLIWLSLDFNEANPNVPAPIADLPPIRKPDQVQQPAVPQNVQETTVATPQQRSMEDRLHQIHSLIVAFQQSKNRYPSGKIHDDAEPARFSWIAELMQDEIVGGVTLASRRSWNDPVNDAFVRRRLENFYNPEIPVAVGEDRYPATHFVGISGIGVDAESLPATHPRAGIFSPLRETRITDVRDGLANTMMVAGAQSNLGSWARPGAATLRSLTQEPYVNGPDGLGTGQPDSMIVLMADGSIRTISRETDPLLTRRLAAMADGLPLDLDVPGDPLKMLATANLPTTTPDPSPAEKPIEALLAADAPMFDINAVLAQKIRSYQIDKPTQLGLLLQEFQELAGIRLEISQLQESELSRTVQLDLEEVTLKELLQELASAGEIDLKIEPMWITLQGKKAAGDETAKAEE